MVTGAFLPVAALSLAATGGFAVIRTVRDSTLLREWSGSPSLTWKLIARVPYGVAASVSR